VPLAFTSLFRNYFHLCIIAYFTVEEMTMLLSIKTLSQFEP